MGGAAAFAQVCADGAQNDDVLKGPHDGRVDEAQQVEGQAEGRGHDVVVVGVVVCADVPGCPGVVAQAGQRGGLATVDVEPAAQGIGGRQGDHGHHDKVDGEQEHKEVVCVPGPAELCAKVEGKGHGNHLEDGHNGCDLGLVVIGHGPPLGRVHTVAVKLPAQEPRLTKQHRNRYELEEGIEEGHGADRHHGLCTQQAGSGAVAGQGVSGAGQRQGVGHGDDNEGVDEDPGPPPELHHEVGRDERHKRQDLPVHDQELVRRERRGQCCTPLADQRHARLDRVGLGRERRHNRCLGLRKRNPYVCRTQCTAIVATVPAHACDAKLHEQLDTLDLVVGHHAGKDAGAHQVPAHQPRAHQGVKRLARYGQLHHSLVDLHHRVAGPHGLHLHVPIARTERPQAAHNLAGIVAGIQVAGPVSRAPGQILVHIHHRPCVHTHPLHLIGRVLGDVAQQDQGAGGLEHAALTCNVHGREGIVARDHDGAHTALLEPGQGIWGVVLEQVAEHDHSQHPQPRLQLAALHLRHGLGIHLAQAAPGKGQGVAALLGVVARHSVVVGRQSGWVHHALDLLK
eukprot:comp24227_c0_seq2/m.44656 comp24227_c0_seq2/g.44656  ORF comp24227_c0_seq2/g.44656 comp24227_c0_seq2/m.44656 type:complete len:568 (+) comp24227_c0_seq2:606-2309(+)